MHKHKHKHVKDSLNAVGYTVIRDAGGGFRRIIATEDRDDHDDIIPLLGESDANVQVDPFHTLS